MKILLSAYLDHNLGDDLFVDYFAEHYRDHEIHLICDDSFILNPQLGKRTNVTKVGTKQAFFAMVTMDALVLIGGSIFQDVPAFYKYDYLRNALVTLARLLGRHVYIIGCNIGPIRSKRGKRISQYCLSMANAISVRDSVSTALLESWKCRTPYLEAADLVFSYPFRPTHHRTATCKRLGLSIINLRRSDRETNSYIEKLTDLAIKHLESHCDHEVLLFGFNGGNENDGVAIAKIMAAISRHGARATPYQYDPGTAINDYLTLLSNCDYVVCSRFHSLVLA